MGRLGVPAFGGKNRDAIESRFNLGEVIQSQARGANDLGCYPGRCLPSEQDDCDSTMRELTACVND